MAEQTREALIKKHFETKVQSLTDQLELVASQAVKFGKAWQVTTERLSNMKITNENQKQQLSTLERERRELEVGACAHG